MGTQAADPTSLLAHTRYLLGLRKASPALREGALEGCVARQDLLAFTRSCAQESLFCAFNLGAGTLTIKAPPGSVLLSINDGSPELLPPFSAVFIRG